MCVSPCAHMLRDESDIVTSVVLVSVPSLLSHGTFCRLNVAGLSIRKHTPKNEGKGEGLVGVYIHIFFSPY